MIFSVMLIYKQNVSIGQDVCFLKFKYRDKKTAERALFHFDTSHGICKCD